MPNEFLDHFLHLPILYFTQVRTAINFLAFTLPEISVLQKHTSSSAQVKLH
jgi:hypothetical protein